MFITRIALQNWRQFGKVELDLAHQATIITGSNGSGKTTILNLISRHFGWSLALVSTPRRRKQLETSWSDSRFEEPSDTDAPLENRRVVVGTIEYSNQVRSELSTNLFTGANYQLDHSGMQGVSGIYIPSHRPMAVYNEVTNIPTNPVAAQHHYNEYQQFMVQIYGGGNIRNPGSVQKRSLISFAVFGEGNKSVQPNPEYLEMFNDFQSKLRIVLPEELGFKKLEIRGGDVVLVTSTGDFSIDAMSGGVNAIFGIAWQIAMFGVGQKERFTVVIDEPENHLHPKMQRSFLPNIAKAFPETRFVVSTHSPFILTSFPEARVYGLFHNRSGQVHSEELTSAELSGTPNTVLREVLGVDSTLPIWVEERIKAVMSKSSGLTQVEFAATVMKELHELGLTDAIDNFETKGRDGSPN